MKIKLLVIFLLFILSISLLLATDKYRYNIGTTKVLEALKNLVNREGEVEVTQYSDNLQWIKLNNTTKKVEFYSSGSFTGSLHTTSAGEIQATSPITSGPEQPIFSVKKSDGGTCFFVTSYAKTVANILQAEIMYINQVISNPSSSPVTVNDSEGLKVTSMAGTGNAYVCVDANGTLYRSALACL